MKIKMSIYQRTPLRTDYNLSLQNRRNHKKNKQNTKDVLRKTKQFQIISIREQSRSIYEKMHEPMLSYKEQCSKIHRNRTHKKTVIKADSKPNSQNKPRRTKSKAPGNYEF